MRKRYVQYNNLSRSLAYFADKDDEWLERKIGLSAAKMLAANKVLGERGHGCLSKTTVELLFTLFQQFLPREEPRG